ncbi:DNA-binding protein [Thiopseudomonas acetoxidans]|uniref:Addiction module antidote protein n=1 Tax=Thiopseudomonas acetoxidans TaxID=3041622 RepID=A0ABT7SL09_9GAMM|nr:hypothetical protein [Thiopseudomonas sp. CY1220]MDM7856873.1 hypothetical protein [Thiopseudomonas sp. CY1220]NLU13340.1 hypothetical protein [Gammaproteobacteria bacterium]
MKSKSFDAANFLETNDDIQEFLAQAASTGDTKHLSHCLNIAIRARGTKEVINVAARNTLNNKAKISTSDK